MSDCDPTAQTTSTVQSTPCYVGSNPDFWVSLLAETANINSAPVANWWDFSSFVCPISRQWEFLPNIGYGFQSRLCGPRCPDAGPSFLLLHQTMRIFLKFPRRVMSPLVRIYHPLLHHMLRGSPKRKLKRRTWRYIANGILYPKLSLFETLFHGQRSMALYIERPET